MSRNDFSINFALQNTLFIAAIAALAFRVIIGPFLLQPIHFEEQVSSFSKPHHYQERVLGSQPMLAKPSKKPQKNPYGHPDSLLAAESVALNEVELYSAQPSFASRPPISPNFDPPPEPPKT